MEFFVKIVSDLTIFSKSFILDVELGSKYTPELAAHNSKTGWMAAHNSQITKCAARIRKLLGLHWRDTQYLQVAF